MKLRRRPVEDELLIDGELVLLVDDSVLVLSEVASTALQGLVTEVWTSWADLCAHLDATVGLPPEGEQAVFSLVSALEDAQLVDVAR